MARDYYETLGVAQRRQRGRAQEGLPWTGDAVPPRSQSRATSRPRSASRRSTRPTRSSPIPTSAPTTTASARSRAAAAVRDSRVTSARCSTTSSRPSASPATGASRASDTIPRRGSGVRDGDHPRGGRRRGGEQDPAAQAGGVRAVQRIPHRARQPLGHVRDVPGSGPGARATGSDHRGAAVSEVRRRGPGQLQPVSGLPRPGPHADRASRVGPDPGRHRRRHDACAAAAPATTG